MGDFGVFLFCIREIAGLVKPRSHCKLALIAMSETILLEAALNLTFLLMSGGNVNISAGGNVNIGATKSMRLTGCDNLSLAGNGSVNIESGGKLDILASGGITQTGSTIHLNGPTASGATCPDKPSITPSHEPWTRPASAITRGKNWKE